MSFRLALLSLLVVTSVARAQTPTFDDVLIGHAHLDAGGMKAILSDIYLPTGATSPTPVVVYIHGGSWQTGDQNDIPQPVHKLLESGIAVATIGNRYCTEAIFPAPLLDVKGLVRHLRGNASSYNIDPTRVACWGVSSGGYLAVMMAVTGGVVELEGNVGGNTQHSSRISAAVDYFGISDILNMGPDVQTPPGILFNPDVETSAGSLFIGFAGPGEGMGVLRENQDSPESPFPEKMELVRSTNPLLYMTLDDAPMFISHGVQDTLVPSNQSQRVFDAAVAAGLGPVFKNDPTAGHGSLPSSTYSESRAFLVRVLFDGPQSTGVPYCFGDGSSLACPCANSLPSTGYVGCPTSLTGGGKLRATGVASVCNDTLSLVGTQLTGATAFFFTGSAMEANGMGAAFGDGLRCIANPTIRLGATNYAHFKATFPMTGQQAISEKFPVSAGTTRYFQASFRDVQSMCGTTDLNATNGLAITYLP